LLTEAEGIPISIEVAGANKNDFKLVRQTFENLLIKKPEKVKSKVCMDKGYDYDEVREIVKEFGFIAHIKSRGEEAKKLKKGLLKRARSWIFR
jgi:hypothetical protein